MEGRRSASPDKGGIEAKDTIAVSISMPRKVADDIGGVAAELGISRSTLMRLLAMSALENGVPERVKLYAETANYRPGDR